MSRSRRSVAASILAAVLLTFAVAPAFAQEAAAGDYVIGPKDLLEVKVLEIPDLNVERRVSEAGTIDLPMVGAFAVNGMSAMQAAENLASVLKAKYVNRANVSIVVKEFANKPLSIVGAVARPGNLNVNGRYTVLQAISAAGGLTAQAGKKIYVIRTAENGTSDILEIRTDDLLRSPTAKWNVPVYPSDVVNVPARSIVKVFCVGEVKTAGALEFDSDDRITLLTAIAKAGGLTERAHKTIRVTRRGDDGRDIEFEYNYKAVASGDVADPELKPDDVIVVKRAFF